MKLRGFITHKISESYSDCADYFQIDKSSGRIAVSDGVSQSFCPQNWSKILVRSFVSGEWTVESDIAPLQKRWLEETKERLQKLVEAGAVTWMMENNIAERRSAAATFCGVTFNGLHYNCDVLGDSSLIHFDKNGNFAIRSSHEGAFNNSPDYFDSYRKTPVGEIRHFEGELGEGETILLVSDPFSEMFQKLQADNGSLYLSGKIEGMLSFVANQDEFCRAVDILRNKYSMHNDDSTLVIIEDDGSEELDVEYASSLEELSEQKAKQENENTI